MHINSKLLIFLSLSIGFILPSCNKNDNHSWEGRVLEYGSNKPVANATVYLVEKSGSGILGPVGSSTVDSLITGADGKFKFKFIDGPVAHYIRGKADLYYETELSRNGNSPSKTKKDLILDPHAWLRIHVKNVNPVDSADFLSIGLNPGDCPKGFPGMIVDTFMLCDKYKGNRTKKLKYAVTKRSTGRVELIKEIQMGAHDTTNIIIEY